MKNIKTQMLAGVVLAFVLLFAPAASVPVSAVSCPEGSLRSSADNAADCNVPENTDGQTFDGSVKSIINTLITLAGLVAVVAVVYGGFLMITSAGDAGKAKTGRDAVLYGVIGVLVAIFAYAIVNFVINQVYEASGGGGGASDNSSQNN